MSLSQKLLPVAAATVLACAGGSEPETAPAPAPTVARSITSTEHQQRFASPEFYKVWARPDDPVYTGRATRSWIYGPDPISPIGLYEQYNESPNGRRQVQYFDKGRLEITNPSAAKDQWYVSRGLLTREMISGSIQVGNNAYIPRAAAQETVAGDAVSVNANCPLYSSFTNLRGGTSNLSGQTIGTRVYRSGTTEWNQTFANYAVKYTQYQSATGHNIADRFWTFMTQTGTVLENGAYVTGTVVDWLQVMGYPITEPYWTRCTVGGVEKDVLVQMFERRVLTYTPSNSAGWQVEMGNVGVHYRRWRYPIGNSLAGVHWYGGDSTMLDPGLPVGKRGWNVEYLPYASQHDQGVFDQAQIAKNHGLVNIIRIDYQGWNGTSNMAVPKTCATNTPECWDWSYFFKERVNSFVDAGLATLFIVGNEPNMKEEGEISPAEYVAAFNHLYANRKHEMRPGVELLVAGPSAFSPIEWFGSVTTGVTATDGFAIHTYGDPTSRDIYGAVCADPRQPCKRSADWNFDGGFRFYRDLIGRIDPKWYGKSLPVYITEFNTDVNGPGMAPNPIDNYQAGWITKAYEDVRNYNNSRGTKPEVRALSWFVDRAGGWNAFSLQYIPTAKTDMGSAFRNGANRM